MVSRPRPRYHPRELDAFLGDPEAVAQRAMGRIGAADDRSIDPLDNPLHKYFEVDEMLRNQLLDQNIYDLRDNVRRKPQTDHFIQLM